MTGARYSRLIGALILGATLLLSACTGKSAGPPAAVQTVAPPTPVRATVLPTATPITPTTTPAPPPADTPTVAPSPTVTPIPTPRPAAVLAVPPAWAAAAGAAVASLNAAGAAAWDWTIIADEEPEALLDNGRAHVALQHNASGAIVRQEPLALAVPFTTNWTWLMRADADAVLANGHAIIRPLAWSEMQPQFKAVRVDRLHPTDDGYPYQDSWSLAAVSGYEAALDELQPHLTDAMAPPASFRLAAVGDIMMDRSPGYVLTTGDLAYPFARVSEVLQTADYTVGNLESSLGDAGSPAAKHYTFQAPPEAAVALALGGFDLVSLANNHAGDFGPDALLQGIDLLNAQSVATVGAGANDAVARAPHVAEINGLRVAFLGYVHVPVEATTNFDTQSWTATADTPGLAWADPATIQADVTAIRPEVDLVIVQLHSGYEYIEEPSEPQAAAAKAAVDAGADLVLGHHAHILQGIQHYGEGVIAYGLGNFVFEIDGPPETAILNVWLDSDGVRQLELIPAFVQEGGRPRLAEDWEATPILDRVHYLTTLLNASPVSQ